MIAKKAYTVSMWFKIDEDLTAEIGALSAIRMALWNITGEHFLYWRYFPNANRVDNQRNLYFVVDSRKPPGIAGGDFYWIIGSDSADNVQHAKSQRRIADDVTIREGSWNHVVLSFDWGSIFSAITSKAKYLSKK